MRANKKFAGVLSATALVAGGMVAMTAAPATAAAVAPSGGCASFFTTGQALEDTTQAPSYLGQPKGAWSDEATPAPAPQYELTSSGGTLVGGTRSFALTYDKGMKSFAAASGTAYWYFKVNGTVLPAVTQSLSLPAGVAAPGATVNGSYNITQGGSNTITFHKMIFESTAGVRVVCSGQDGNTAALNSHTTPVDTNVTTSFQAFAVAAASINSISNQSVTTHARRADVITFTGSAFSADGTGTAQLCDTAGANCNATSSTFTITGGTGTGSIAVPASFTGAKALKLSSNGEVGLKPITIMGGAGTLTGDLTGGGAGTVVTLSGSGFDPLEPVEVQSYSGSGQTSAPTTDPVKTVTSDANGAFSTTYTVNAANTTNIIATDPTRMSPANPAVSFLIPAAAPFAFSGDSCTAKTGAATTGACSMLETVNLTVVAGDLKMSKDAGTVTLGGNTALNGTAQTATGSLRDITVQDYRGGTLGWSLTGTFSGLNTTGASIAPNKLTWTPDCAADTNNDDTVVTGAQSAFANASTALGLCSVTSGLGADGVSGGDTAADAGLSLDLLANQKSGSYVGTLTLTLA